MSLTDSKLKALKPEPKVYRISDGGGLSLEVRPSGVKVWRYRFQWLGKATMQSLGEYPSVSLAQARTKRDEAKALLKSGSNPVTQSRLSKATTFRAVAEEYLLDQAKVWTPRVHRAAVSLFEREIFPRLGNMPVADVKPVDVLSVVRAVEKKRPITARRIQQAIGAVCRFAVVTLRREDDPTQAIRGALKAHKPKHHAVMKDHELKAFYEALKQSEAYPAVSMAGELLILTTTRTMELLGAQWDEFDLEAGIWIVPAARMKMRRDHVVPLVPAAVELLKLMQPLARGSRFVLPARGDRSKPAGNTTLYRLWSSLTDGQFGPHGARGTFSTWAHDAGFDTLIIEAQLNHVDKNQTRASYNRSAYLNQRRDMLEHWASHLEAVKSGGKVVPFRRKAG